MHIKILVLYFITILLQRVRIVFRKPSFSSLNTLVLIRNQLVWNRSIMEQENDCLHLLPVLTVMDPIIIWHNCLLIISHVLVQKLTVNRQARGLSLTLSFVDLSQKCIIQRIWTSCCYWAGIWFKFLGTLSRIKKSPSCLKNKKTDD